MHAAGPHSHSHAGHSPGVAADADRGKLWIALGLIVGFMAVEVAVGLIAGSLALLSDAAHMLSDAAALTLALRALDATFYPYVSGNDHLSRDTGSAIERSGFEIESCERFRFSPAALIPPDEHILGTARRT